MIKNLLPSALLCLCCIATYAQEARDTETDRKDTRSGQFIKNPSFEDEMHSIRNRRFGPNGEGELFGGRLPKGYIPGWVIINDEEATSKIEISTEELLDKTQQKALRWSITEATEAAPATIMNASFHGIEVTKGERYTLSFWARADKRYKGPFCVGLFNRRTGEWCAQATIKGKIKKRWKKYTITFVADKEDEKARFVMTAGKAGTLYLDEVSLIVED